MPGESEQTVIEVKIIDVDRFVFRRPNRERMEISDGNTAERIAFDTKIAFQIVLRRIIQHNFMTDRQQNWPMKKNQQHEGDREANQDPTPKPPLTPRVCLIILGHRATLLPAMPQSKGQIP